MENIVFSAKMFNGYFVSYPFGSHKDFVATSYKAMKDGLIFNKDWSYKPTIFIIETWNKTPKFRKLTSVQSKAIFTEIGIK